MQSVHRIIVFMYMGYLQYTGMKLHGLKLKVVAKQQIRMLSCIVERSIRRRCSDSPTIVVVVVVVYIYLR